MGNTKELVRRLAAQSRELAKTRRVFKESQPPRAPVQTDHREPVQARPPERN